MKKIALLFKNDEGFQPVAKWDIKQWSYGYGCRAPGEGAVIAESAASGRNRRGTSKMKIWITAIMVLGAFVAGVTHCQAAESSAFDNMSTTHMGVHASCEDALFNPDYGVFRDEGGYQNSKNDGGNWSSGKIGKGHMCGGTKYGIACAYHPGIDIKNLTKAGAAAIYERNECRDIRIDKLAGARDPAMLLGLAVNQGGGTAVKNLKESRNAFRRIEKLPPLPINTTMDADTIAWFNETTKDPDKRLAVLMSMALLGIDRATDIVDSNPKQAGNLMGWVERWNPLNYK